MAVATDCAFARLDDVIMGRLRNKLPSWWPEVLREPAELVLRAAMNCVPVFSTWLYGYDISDVNPEEAVRFCEMLCAVLPPQQPDYTAANTPTDTQAFIHAYIHTQTYMHIHTYMHTYHGTYIYIHIHTYIFIYIHIYIHTYT